MGARWRAYCKWPVLWCHVGSDMGPRLCSNELGLAHYKSNKICCWRPANRSNYNFRDVPRNAQHKKLHYRPGPTDVRVSVHGIWGIRGTQDSIILATRCMDLPCVYCWSFMVVRLQMLWTTRMVSFIMALLHNKPPRYGSTYIRGAGNRTLKQRCLSSLQR